MAEDLDETINNIRDFYIEDSKKGKVLLKKIKKYILDLRHKDFNLLMVFPFGKFKGTPIKDVPPWYLLWCYEQPWFKENNGQLYLYIKKNRRKLKKQNENR